MAGYSVTIRLLDPPLHEFLPTKEQDIKDLAKEKTNEAIEKGKEAAEKGKEKGKELLNQGKEALKNLGK